MCPHCFATTSDVSGAHANNSTDNGQDPPSAVNAVNSPFVPNGDFQWGDTSGGQFCDFIMKK